MGLFKFLFSKYFVINVVLVTVLGLLALVGVYFGLDVYTQHNVSVKVPDFTGLPLAEIESTFDSLAIEYVLIDSLYSNELPRGTVADQEPKPGASVKNGRKIYLTVNAVLPQQVGMPDLRNLSFGQAKAILETFGLQVGNLEYRPDIAKNAVLDQKIKGNSVPKGKLVFKGTVIDLVLGDGLSNTRLPVPYLTYLRLDEATERLKSWSFNLATYQMDTTVTDSGLARVYRQVPEFKENQLLPLGSSIILYLTQDTMSIEYDSTLYEIVPMYLDSMMIGEQINELHDDE